MFEGASVVSGYSLREPSDFSARFYRVFNSALGIKKDAPVEDIDIDSIEDDEDEEKVKKADEEEEDLDN